MHRLKRCQENIKNDKFLSAKLCGKFSFYEEIRRSRDNKSTMSTQIDGEIGSNKIAEHFAGIYRNLYTSVENGGKFTDVKSKVHSLIDGSSIDKLLRIDAQLIRRALNKMKPKKSDALYNVVSDMYMK